MTEALSATNPPHKLPTLLPDISDPVVAPFWAGTQQSRLMMQQCTKCRVIRWPPAPICPECLTPGGEWGELSGRGTVWSYAVYHRGFHADFAGRVPYVVLLVGLAEGPHMISSLPEGVPASDIAIGAPVRARYTQIAPGISVVQFGPSSDALSEPLT